MEVRILHFIKNNDQSPEAGHIDWRRMKIDVEYLMEMDKNNSARNNLTSRQIALMQNRHDLMYDFFVASFDKFKKDEK